MTVLDLALYQLLANVLKVSLLNVEPAVSAVWIATPLVVLANFFVSHRFVWHSTVSRAKTVVPFFGLYLFSGIGVQSLVIHGVIGLLSGNAWMDAHADLMHLFAKCVAIGAGMVINFAGSRHLFRWGDDERT